MCEALIQRFWPKRKHNLFKFENMTVTTPPLLKVYYWEFFDIDKLNEKIDADETMIEHTVEMPPRQLNSHPLKIVLWLRNLSEDKLEMRLKRRQNCGCVPMETRVGFNQYRKLYHCPHRGLVHVLQEHTYIHPDELVALRVIFYYFLFGEHTLTYEIRTNDDRVILLNFKVRILNFSPADFLLTKELIPTNIREFRRLLQPIWFFNLTTYNMGVKYFTRERGLKLVNPNFEIPRLCARPLVVKYRPSDLHNELEIYMKIGDNRKKYYIKAEGTLADIPADSYVPIEDVPCTDYPFAIYPNKVEFEMKMSELRCRMVAVHNDGQTCLEFRWQPYYINELFDVNFEPATFRLKPHHTKFCVVILRSHDCPLHFKRVPLALLVHRIVDKSTRIATELLQEVESIDDPKWKEHNYLTHMFLHLNVKVHFKVQETANVHWEPQSPQSLVKEPTATVFEKFFWEYLSESRHMRRNVNPKISSELKYSDVIHKNLHPIESSYNQLKFDRDNIFREVTGIMVECLHDLAQHWIFVPIGYGKDKRHPHKRRNKKKCEEEEKDDEEEKKDDGEEKKDQGRHVTIKLGEEKRDAPIGHEEKKKGHGGEKKAK